MRNDLYSYNCWKGQLSPSRLTGLRLELQETTSLDVVVSTLSRRTFPEFGGRGRGFNSITNLSINTPYQPKYSFKSIFKHKV